MSLEYTHPNEHAVLPDDLSGDTFSEDMDLIDSSDDDSSSDSFSRMVVRSQWAENHRTQLAKLIDVLRKINRIISVEYVGRDDFKNSIVASLRRWEPVLSQLTGDLFQERRGLSVRCFWNLCEDLRAGGEDKSLCFNRPDFHLGREKQLFKQLRHMHNKRGIIRVKYAHVKSNEATINQYSPEDCPVCESGNGMAILITYFRHLLFAVQRAIELYKTAMLVFTHIQADPKNIRAFILEGNSSTVMDNNGKNIVLQKPIYSSAFSFI